MNDLERFRDHCRRMSTPGTHRPECDNRAACAGCVSDPDRHLFKRLADEVDCYLAGDDGEDFEEVDLFGQAAPQRSVGASQ